MVSPNTRIAIATLAATLADRGISCFAYDQRGHGSRPGKRTHVERFEDFVDDLNLAAESLRRRRPICRCSCGVTAWARSS